MKAIVILVVLMLSACSQTPDYFILAPDQQVGPLQINVSGARNLSVVDHRSQQYLVKINEGEEKSGLISGEQSATTTLSNSLLARLSQPNINLDNVTYIVEIKQLLINVDQSAIKYDSNSKITLIARVTRNGRTLSKTFNRTGNSYGPLQADLAVLERDFNLMLGQMLDDVARDAELLALIEQ